MCSNLKKQVITLHSHHTPTKKLHDILNEECIYLEYLNLISAHGFYVYLEECTVIGISNAIGHNEKLFRTVLAEEIGHHFTIISNKQPTQYLTYSDRLGLDKSESAALTWAADFLIPTKELLNIIGSGGCQGIHDIEEAFEVCDYLVLHKLKNMANKSLAYPLSDGRQLILSSLPSLFVYDSFE